MLIKKALQKSPLLVPGAFFILFALIFFLNRLALFNFYSDTFADLADKTLTFPVGLRMDTIILCQSLIIPVLLATIFNIRKSPLITKLMLIYFSTVSCIFIFMEIATWPFIAEFGSRPNQLFFIYFTHPKEVLGTIWAEQKLLMLMSVIVLAITWALSWRIMKAIIHYSTGQNFIQRLLWLPIVASLLLLGARSGIGEAVANPSLAAFSNNHTANQLALNSTYSLAYSLYLQNSEKAMRMESLYGDMPRDEVIARIKRTSGISEAEFFNTQLPTLHTQPTVAKADKPRNLVIILMESMGAEFVGHLNGLPLTPNLDRLATQGLNFQHMYSIGQRTHRGMEALASGYLPTSKGSSIMRLDLAQKDFFTIGQLLKPHGYHTSFIYNGESHFDGMSGFLLGNGFDNIIDLTDFKDPVFKGTWGVSDEDLFTKANEYFNSLQQPFASIILTLSNHTPYEFPDGRIELYDETKSTPHNSAKYADYAIGKFFDAAQQHEYFSNTVFVLVADHPMRIRSQGLVPVESFQIPAIILAPNLTPNSIEEVASQIDLLPTAMGLLGMPLTHPMTGRNWLLSTSKEGKAIMFYDQSHAYRFNNHVVIHQPKKAATQFLVQDGTLIEEPLNDELRRDALAHILFPGIVYRERLYRIP